MVYNTHGDLDTRKYSGGGSYMKQGRNTTQEEQVQIVRECIASGKNYGEIALKYQVSYQQVRNWTLRFEEMGKQDCKTGAATARKTKFPVPNWNRHKLRLSNSSISCIWQKLDEVERKDAFQK